MRANELRALGESLKGVISSKRSPKGKLKAACDWVVDSVSLDDRLRDQIPRVLNQILVVEGEEEARVWSRERYDSLEERWADTVGGIGNPGQELLKVVETELEPAFEGDENSRAWRKTLELLALLASEVNGYRLGAEHSNALFAIQSLQVGPDGVAGLVRQAEAINNSLFYAERVSRTDMTAALAASVENRSGPAVRNAFQIVQHNSGMSSWPTTRKGLRDLAEMVDRHLNLMAPRPAPSASRPAVPQPPPAAVPYPYGGTIGAAPPFASAEDRNINALIGMAKRKGGPTGVASTRPAAAPARPAGPPKRIGTPSKAAGRGSSWEAPPKPKGGTTRRPPPSFRCYRCGGRGHRQAVCPTPPGDASSGAEKKKALKPQSNYHPSTRSKPTRWCNWEEDPPQVTLPPSPSAQAAEASTEETTEEATQTGRKKSKAIGKRAKERDKGGQTGSKDKKKGGKSKGKKGKKKGRKKGKKGKSKRPKPIASVRDWMRAERRPFIEVGVRGADVEDEDEGIGAVYCAALLDTGSELTYISRATAEEAGVTMEQNPIPLTVVAWNGRRTDTEAWTVTAGRVDLVPPGGKESEDVVRLDVTGALVVDGLDAGVILGWDAMQAMGATLRLQDGRALTRGQAVKRPKGRAGRAKRARLARAAAAAAYEFHQGGVIQGGRITENEVNFGPEVEDEERQRVVDLLNQHLPTVRGELPFRVTDMMEFSIAIRPGTRPFYALSRPRTWEEQRRLEAAESKLQEKGIAEEIPEGERTGREWSLRVFTVPKKGTDEGRFVMDARPPNAACHSWPGDKGSGTWDALLHMKRKRWMARLDLASAFFSIPASDAAKEVFTWTNARTNKAFRLTRMAMGATDAPGTFDRLMRIVLGELYGEEVLAYLDDLLLMADTKEELIALLEDVLRRLGKAGLTLGLSKCEFLVRETEFLGLTVSEEGVTPSVSRLQGIRDLEHPTSFKELESALGLFTYLESITPGLGAPKARLLDYKERNKGQAFRWSRARAECFEEMKRLVMDAGVAIPELDKGGWTLMTDASNLAVGAALFQELDGRPRLVAAASRKLSKEQTDKWSIWKKECFAIAWATRRFEYILRGRKEPVVTVTDNKTLAKALRNRHPSTVANATVRRWMWELAEFNLDVIHRKSEENPVADALSRPPRTRSAVASARLERHEGRVTEALLHGHRYSERMAARIEQERWELATSPGYQQWLREGDQDAREEERRAAGEPSPGASSAATDDVPGVETRSRGEAQVTRVEELGSEEEPPQQAGHPVAADGRGRETPGEGAPTPEMESPGTSPDGRENITWIKELDEEGDEDEDEDDKDVSRQVQATSGRDQTPRAVRKGVESAKETERNPEGIEKGGGVDQTLLKWAVDLHQREAHPGLAGLKQRVEEEEKAGRLPKPWNGRKGATLELATLGCEACLRMKPGQTWGGRAEGPKSMDEGVTRLNQRWFLDVMGPYTVQGARRYVLLGVEAFSRHVTVAPLESTTAGETRVALGDWFGKFGRPEEILSDNGPNFSAEELRLWLKKRGCEQLFSSPHHSEGNSAAERAIGSLKDRWRSTMADIPTSAAWSEWLRSLFAVVESHNSLRSSTTGETPFGLRFGFSHLGQVGGLDGVRRTFTEARRKRRRQLEELSKREGSSRKGAGLQPGTEVWRRVSKTEATSGETLKRDRFKGPFTVEAQLERNGQPVDSYAIRRVSDGRRFRSNGVHLKRGLSMQKTMAMGMEEYGTTRE